MRAERISPQAARVLRRRILRPESLSDDGVAYAEDSVETTATFGCREDGSIVSVGTVMAGAHPRDAKVGDWRIRGMATDDGYRNRGFGQLILDALLDHAGKQGGRRVWCNARVDAALFYERSGFVRHGEAFLTAGDRPHYLLDLHLPNVS